MLNGYGEGTEALAQHAVEADGRLKKPVSSTTLARLERLDPSSIEQGATPGSSDTLLAFLQSL